MADGARSSAAGLFGADGGGEADSAVRRFFVAAPLAAARLTISGDLAHRLMRVLRLAVGTELELFDGGGQSRRVRIAAADRRSVTLQAMADVRVHPPEPDTVLYAGLIRPGRFEWLIEKATELGVTTIQPVLCERGAVRATELGPTRLTRWRRIAVEAAEQSGRTVVPSVRPPAPLAAVLREPRGRLVIAAEPSHGPAPPLGSVLADLGDAPLAVLIGPEGGFAPDELAAAIAVGGRPASLGPHILRSETAAVAALAIAVDARDGGLWPSDGRRQDRAWER